MSHLWLPENEHAEDLVVDRAWERLGAAREFRAALKAIDERLDLVWAPEGSTSVPKDNRWYIIRRGDSGIGGMWMCEDEHGEYCEPNERHLDALCQMDPSKTGNAHRRIADGRAARKAAREAHRADKSAEFRESLLDRLDHIYDARVFVSAANAAKLQKTPA
jgi:hypothetical protein